MTKHQCDGYLDEIQERSEGDVVREMLRVMMQEVMEEELARHLGAERHERTEQRTGHRNGYKPRTFKTRVGEIALAVPQARGTEPYSPLFFAKWERSERALLVACAEMYFMGVSTRKVKKVLEKMGGFELSASTVSCVAQELDEKLTEFRQRRLDDHAWVYLMADATYVKVRKKGRVVEQAVLVVAGINDAGRREILTWRLADVESEDTWTEVFRELKHRGVHGVQWVISDGHAGIRAAVRTQFTGVSWQRCWTHFMRNALAKVGHKHKDALAKELVAARKFDDVQTCLMEAERVAERWERDYPRLAEQIREQFEETLSVHDLPQEHRRRVYTTNILERLMREIKRRTHVVGIFPNESSCDRLVGAHLLERHESWQCERMRYLVMDHLEQASSQTLEQNKVA
ncbi:MAG TPA: IS256 family transposase [Candidatus Hydrogenedentes bacterium]|nr:IS256 family transposase [Candidatus Hydrogenedentota bacterium]HPG66067.1 IS256 family transposase [Candidatus Hydrogenedentota bacterium]